LEVKKLVAETINEVIEPLIFEEPSNSLTITWPRATSVVS